MERVDGFTVERVDGKIVLTLTNIYGQGDVFYFTPEDAMKIAETLIKHYGV